MTRSELAHKIDHATAILTALALRRKNYLALSNQADPAVINKICSCSYKIGVMKSYIAKLERKLYSR
jgi:hypothetical protein